MKKTLSLLLAFILALSCGLCAFALEPSDPAAVTGLTAEWNGQIQLRDYGIPAFNACNVDVTLTYDDRESEALENWKADDGSWRVWCKITGETAAEFTVTVYYCDKSRENEPESALPQTTFTAPVNQREMLVNAQRPLEILTPNQQVTAVTDTVAEGLAYKVHAFTAEQGGLHLVEQFCYGDFYLLNENYGLVADVDSYNSGGDGMSVCFVELEAGKTYYIISTGRSKASYQIKVTDGLRKIPDRNGLEILFFWQVKIYGNYSIPLSRLTFSEALREMGRNLLNALFIIITFPFLWWAWFA